MNLTLPPELESFVAKQIQGGQFPNADAVIGEGLRLLRDQEVDLQMGLEDLKREIAIGIEQADQGKVTSFSAVEILAELRAQKKALAK